MLDLFNQNETAVMALTDASAIEQLNSWFREVPKKYGCYDLDGSINGKKHTCDCKANVCTPEKCGAVKGIFTEDCQSCSCVSTRPTNRVLVCAARTLIATGQSRATLSPRYEQC